ncbi:MAG TPA: hypothetical protein VMU88_01615 [bacterium]|nr:hypothetical protein [bacterium]
MKKTERKRKSLAVMVILLAIGLPLACTTNNSSSPTTPITIGGSPTNTPSGPTATFTPTLLPGATPTFTPTFLPTPVFLANYDTSASPNGLYYDGTYLYVASGDPGVTMFDKWTVSVGSLSPAPIPGATPVAYSRTRGNLFVTGYPTPQPPPPTPGITPAWSGTTIVANLPQAYAESGPYYGLLDSTTSGSATFWSGCETLDPDSIAIGTSQYPGFTNGYDGIAFSSPKAMVGDGFGNFYVADTGNKYIEEFEGDCPSGPPPAPDWEHYWDGSSSTKPFIKPVALACDSSGNVYVGDAGYSPSVVEKWASGGTTVLGMWNLAQGAVINGLAVDNNGNFYVTDTGNGGKVEEYTINSSTSATLVRSWGGPAILPKTMIPSSIQLIMAGSTLVNIIVGDNNNRFLLMFGP